MFHDDQHGTAIVTVAAVLNSLKLVKKDIKKVKIVVLGAGAAGYGITNLLVYAGAKNIIVLDSHGAIFKGRKNINKYKDRIANITNSNNIKGNLETVINGSDVFIGVSGHNNILTAKMIKSMNEDPIIFALSNPDPEINPYKAKKAGAKIIATGRSDFKNQVNNDLVFPFFVRKILDNKIKKISDNTMYQMAKKIASVNKKLSDNHIISNIDEIKSYYSNK